AHERKGFANQVALPRIPERAFVRSEIQIARCVDGHLAQERHAAAVLESHRGSGLALEGKRGFFHRFFEPRRAENCQPRRSGCSRRKKPRRSTAHRHPKSHQQKNNPFFHDEACEYIRSSLLLRRGRAIARGRGAIAPSPLPAKAGTPCRAPGSESRLQPVRWAGELGAAISPKLLLRPD